MPPFIYYIPLTLIFLNFKYSNFNHIQTLVQAFLSFLNEINIFLAFFGKKISEHSSLKNKNMADKVN